MRLIRRVVVLAIIGAGGVAAYNYWSNNAWPIRSRALEAATAHPDVARLASRAAAKASAAASTVTGRVSAAASTAKIKSKMALDDHVNARAIDVDTSGSVVTLTGVVVSEAERDRAVRLARETEGITRVIDRLRIKKLQ